MTSAEASTVSATRVTKMDIGRTTHQTWRCPSHTAAPFSRRDYSNALRCLSSINDSSSHTPAVFPRRTLLASAHKMRAGQATLT